MESRLPTLQYLFLEELDKSALMATWRVARLFEGKADRFYLAGVIHANLSDDPEFEKAFLTIRPETSVQANHPCILKKVKVYREQEQLIVLWEHVKGFSLRQVLEHCRKDGFPLAIEHISHIFNKLLPALIYAKDHYLPHGLVNPETVLITHEGEIKLRGFALSHAIRAHSDGPACLGEAFSHYMPPKPEVGYSENLDIFACGAILFELLVGEPLPRQVLNDVPGSLRQLTFTSGDEPFPEAFKSILRASLDSNYEMAYLKLEEMLADLQGFLASDDYNPSTYNIAFFMNSIFRSELEHLHEKEALERAACFRLSSLTVPSIVLGSEKEPPTLSIGLPSMEKRGPSSRETGQDDLSRARWLWGGVAFLVLAFLLWRFF